MNMIHPSYVELMKVVNDEGEIGEEPVVKSRFPLPWKSYTAEK